MVVLIASISTHLTCLQPAILTTMDIISDGFGFMLSVGDLVWVPFVYSLQARYLAFHPKDLGYAWSAAILAVNFLGYWIFRSANNEKNEFRNGRNPKSQFHRQLSLCGICLNSRRSHVHAHRAWHEAFDFRLVGSLSPPKLYVRFLPCSDQVRFLT